MYVQLHWVRAAKIYTMQLINIDSVKVKYVFWILLHTNDIFAFICSFYKLYLWLSRRKYMSRIVEMQLLWYTRMVQLILEMILSTRYSLTYQLRFLSTLVGIPWELFNDVVAVFTILQDNISMEILIYSNRQKVGTIRE